MQKFTTYIMCGEHTSKDDYENEVQLDNIVGVAMIEKNVRMTTGQDCTLIHYLYIKPGIRHQNIGIIVLKTIISQPEYINRKIMAVTSLHQSS